MAVESGVPSDLEEVTFWGGASAPRAARHWAIAKCAIDK